MEIIGLAKKLEGLQNVDSIAKTLNISRRTAINYVWKLRRQGLVETAYQKRKIRMYRISTVKKPLMGYPGLHETINKYSKVKVVTPYEHKLYTHKMTAEEAVVRAVKLGSFRTLLASLGLFNKITNWHRLYVVSEKEGIGRKIGALYDTAKTIIRVKRMDKRTRNALLESNVESKFIIGGLKTRDFKEIENLWKVYIPFNKADLEVYKE